MYFDGFLAGVVYSTIRWHVEGQWSFVHVSDEMQWEVVFFTAINDVAMKSDYLLLVIIWQTLC